MSEKISRRKLFLSVGTLGIGVLGGATVASGVARPASGFVEYPWPYKKIEATQAAETAYRSMRGNGCMFGAFNGILGTLSTAYGEPYSSFPTAMMTYGRGGAVGWGTLCGALNGAAAAISLFVDGDDKSKLINDLFNWYVQAELPLFVPGEPPDQVKIEPKKALSPLCHVSLANSGYFHSPMERGERCARLTSDVAQRTVMLLNARLEGGNLNAFSIMPETAECLECHSGAGKGPQAVTKMNCIDCHPKDAAKK
jgi:hypothetical protein